MSFGNGPIASIAIRVIGATVDRTNLGAFLTAVVTVSFFDKYCIKSRISCKNVRHKSLEFIFRMTLLGSEFSEPRNGHSDVP